MDSLDQASAEARPPKLSPAARKTRQQFNHLCLRGPEGYDSLVCQISCVIKRAWISEIVRRIKFDGKPQTLSIAEQVRSCGCGFFGFIPGFSVPRFFILCLMAVDADAQAGADNNACVLRP